MSGPLRVRASREGESYEIALAGELDLSSEGELMRELQRAEESSARSIVLELSELRFTDSTGIRCLVLAASNARASGRSLEMRGASEEIRQVFRIAAVESELPLVDD